MPAPGLVGWPADGAGDSLLSLCEYYTEVDDAARTAIYQGSIGRLVACRVMLDVRTSLLDPLYPIRLRVWGRLMFYCGTNAAPCRRA